MQDQANNRAALLTAHGPAAIAVVRVTGDGVQSFLSKHFSKPLKPNRCVHGNLLDGQRTIDDPVIVLHQQGADINLHGGEWVVQECLNLAQREGFRFVNASDLVDATTILEREMLQALPQARTERAIRTLLAQPSLWSSFLSLQPSSFDRETIAHILNDRSLWWMLNPPKIAIVGIPNVGKSTLANHLFGQQRSITADIPGTTRDWVGDWADIDGLPVQLLDTPGQRNTTDPIEGEAIARSRQEIETADLVLLVLDPTQSPQEQQALRECHPNAIIVINKSDLPEVWKTRSIEAVRTIATTGGGVDELRAKIVNRYALETDSPYPLVWTDRQREILTRAIHDAQALKELDTAFNRSTA